MRMGRRFFERLQKSVCCLINQTIGSKKNPDFWAAPERSHLQFSLESANSFDADAPRLRFRFENVSVRMFERIANSP